MLSIPQSLYDLVISFFDTPLNLTIYFHAVLNRISSEFIDIVNSQFLFMETIINALLEIFSTHNFVACTNVSFFFTSLRSIEACVTRHCHKVLMKLAPHIDFGPQNYFLNLLKFLFLYISIMILGVFKIPLYGYVVLCK